jgi:D-alanyl-D-alanine carboxypeptidase
MRTGGKFYIYSITKTFTAVRILQLTEAGALDLDAPISSYLRDTQLSDRITVRRLLNHTSGLPNYTELPEYMPATRASPGSPWSYEFTRDLTCAKALDFEPGAGWHYSNTGYMLLVRLMESVTGESFAQNMEVGIAQPLGLKSTYVAEEVDDGSLVPGYCRYLSDNQAMENVIPRYHPWWCKTGLIVSTTEETTSFLVRLFAGSLLRESSLAEMKTWVSADNGAKPVAPVMPPHFRKPGYGLGLMIDPDWGHGGFFGHGGDGPGYTTMAVYLPDFHGRHIALSVFTNTSLGGPPFYLIKDLLNVLADSAGCIG